MELILTMNKLNMNGGERYILPAKNTLVQKRLKWCCLRCNGKFAKEYALMLHLAHFHYFELLIPMKSKRIEFAEKAYYSCTQKNCDATFNTSKALGGCRL